MAEDRANDSARVPDLNYKSVREASNIASVSKPEGKHGRPRVQERTAEELGPRDMTKFDPKNKHHVGLITAKDESTSGLMMHPGGYFSFPAKKGPAKKSTQRPAEKAVAKPEGKPEAKPKKKMSNLEKAQAALDAAKRAGKI